eukprot:3550731-Amphidinium_carterae.2
METLFRARWRQITRARTGKGANINGSQVTQGKPWNTCIAQKLDGSGNLTEDYKIGNNGKQEEAEEEAYYTLSQIGGDEEVSEQMKKRHTTQGAEVYERYGPCIATKFEQRWDGEVHPSLYNMARLSHDCHPHYVLLGQETTQQLLPGSSQTP